MVKYEDKIVANYLKLYFYDINRDQMLIVMYLELISTGIKTERWKVAGLLQSQTANPGIEKGR